jgi:hypothetical protein
MTLNDYVVDDDDDNNNNNNNNAMYNDSKHYS